MAFVKVDTRFRHDLARLGPKATIVYLYLGLCVNGDGDAWPSQHKISQETGLTRGEVQTALARLHQLGFIIVHHHQEGPRYLRNSYTVNHHFHYGRKPKPDQLPLGMAFAPEPCNHTAIPQTTAQSSQPLVDSVADTGTPAPPAERRTIEAEPDTTYLGAERPARPETPTELRVLPTPEARREYVAAAESMPRALYSALVTLFPGGGFPAPGGGARCPAIGRLGAMEKAHGWGRVLEEMEHARIDQAVGKVAQGDILSWIERRLQGGVRSRSARPGSHEAVCPGDISLDPDDYKLSDWPAPVGVQVVG